MSRRRVTKYCADCGKPLTYRRHVYCMECRKKRICKGEMYAANASRNTAIERRAMDS